MYLCKEDELEELTTKQFEYLYLGDIHHGFVINCQGKLFAYENKCPHTGVELNWQENSFLNYDNSNIQCATHGAQFQINDGFCIWGPCIGQYLKEIPLKVVSNKVYLDLNE
jgi:nitrite reductase/ring-hydroxylating ferredoxin subunit